MSESTPIGPEKKSKFAEAKVPSVGEESAQLVLMCFENNSMSLRYVLTCEPTATLLEVWT